jgi:hypothetical protein
MKTLNYEQMEFVYGGKFLSCLSQVAGGMGTLAGIAAALTFASNPVGWGILLIGGISLVAGIASDPTACD